MNDTIENQKDAEIAMTVADEDVNAMLKAGVHIGHVPSKTHPKMAPFIFANRNGMAIFDLIKTKEKLLAAEAFISKLVAEDKLILFVGTKPSAKGFIKKIGERHGYPVIADRWIGGTLTNYKVILGRIQELERLEREKAEGGFRKYTKKEAMGKEEEIAHLEKSFGGLRKLKKIPDAVFLADIDENDLAVREAFRMHVPTIAITDSNTDPTPINYPIPANDNSTPALEYVFGRIEKAIEEGKKGIKAPESQEL